MVVEQAYHFPLLGWQLFDRLVGSRSRRVGRERVAERDAAAAFEALPPAGRFVAPEGVTPPDVAVGMVDGGPAHALSWLRFHAREGGLLFTWLAP